MSDTKRDYILSNGSYDILKQVVQLGLPAIGTLYFTLATIWGLPRGEEVVGSIAALTVFLGVFLKIADKSYNSSEDKYDGTIDVDEALDGTKVASLTLSNYDDPIDVVSQSEVLFKVKGQNPNL